MLRMSPFAKQLPRALKEKSSSFSPRSRSSQRGLVPLCLYFLILTRWNDLDPFLVPVLNTHSLFWRVT